MNYIKNAIVRDFLITCVLLKLKTNYKIKGLKMDSYNLEDQYAEYLYEHTSINNGHQLITKMENGYLLDDFLNSIGLTLEQYQEITG